MRGHCFVLFCAACLYLYVDMCVLDFVHDFLFAENDAWRKMIGL